jgi:hypothetical protein
VVVVRVLHRRQQHGTGGSRHVTGPVSLASRHRSHTQPQPRPSCEAAATLKYCVRYYDGQPPTHHRGAGHTRQRRHLGTYSAHKTVQRLCSSASSNKAHHRRVIAKTNNRNDKWCRRQPTAPRTMGARGGTPVRPQRQTTVTTQTLRSKNRGPSPWRRTARRRRTCSSSRTKSSAAGCQQRRGQRPRATRSRRRWPHPSPSCTWCGPPACVDVAAVGAALAHVTNVCVHAAVCRAAPCRSSSR